MKCIVLYNKTALEAWDLGLCSSATLVETLDPDTIAGSSAEIALFDSLYPQLTRPIHLLSPSKSARRQSRSRRCHVLSRPLPRHSFFQMEGNVNVAAPWLCYINIASQLTFAQAALMGMELCGRYSTLPLHRAANRLVAGKGYLERPPIVTPRQIRSYVAAMGLNRNTPAARAAQVLEANARSPMEAVLHIMMRSHASQGGYGFTDYGINQDVPLAPELARIVGVDSYECDYYWRSHGVALEYDGRDYHTSDEQRAHDNTKRSVLSQMGIKVFTIDKHKLYDFEMLDGIMRMLAASIGERPPSRSTTARARRMRLHGELTSHDLVLYR